MEQCADFELIAEALRIHLSRRVHGVTAMLTKLTSGYPSRRQTPLVSSCTGSPCPPALSKRETVPLSAIPSAGMTAIFRTLLSAFNSCTRDGVSTTPAEVADTATLLQFETPRPVPRFADGKSTPNPTTSPVRQKLRVFVPVHHLLERAETDELVDERSVRSSGAQLSTVKPAALLVDQPLVTRPYSSARRDRPVVVARTSSSVVTRVTPPRPTPFKGLDILDGAVERSVHSDGDIEEALVLVVDVGLPSVTSPSSSVSTKLYVEAHLDAVRSCGPPTGSSSRILVSRTSR